MKPTKLASQSKDHMTKAKRETRSQVEETFKGESDKVDMPYSELTESQLKIRKKIIEEIGHFASNIDVFLIDHAAVVLDRIISLEVIITENPNNMFEQPIMRAKSQYFNEFIKICNELCMSPQSRAKVANTVAQQKAKNPLLEILGE